MNEILIYEIRWDLLTIEASLRDGRRIHGFFDRTALGGQYRCYWRFFVDDESRLEGKQIGRILSEFDSAKESMLIKDLIEKKGGEFLDGEPELIQSWLEGKLK